ncbi:MAG: hypothetical protein JO101_05910 [Candidatus Eremiobacteraeota bacterium]|nr:hypothetical protein [Candidatus Eremiobacteraeota bacterium]
MPHNQSRARRLLRCLILVGLASTGAVQAAPLGAQTPARAPAEPSKLLEHVINCNGDLRSFEASIDISFRKTSFPFLGVSLSGTAYYRKPDKFAVTFAHIPGIMRGFPEAYASMMDVGTWQQRFVVGDDGAGSANGRTGEWLTLKPRDPRSGLVLGRVLVDTSTWTIAQADWDFQHDMHFAVAQDYETVGSYELLADQRWQVHVPYARAVGTTTLRDYHANVAIDDGVFSVTGS